MQTEYAAAFAPPVSKPLFERKKSDVVMFALTVFLMILSVSALIWDGAALGYTLCFDVYFIIATVFLARRGASPGVKYYIIAALTLICSWTFAATSDFTVRTLSVIATAISSLVWHSALAGKKYPSHDAALVEYAGSTLFFGIDGIPDVLKAIFTKDRKKSKRTRAALIGALVAFPLFMIVTALLSHSDAAFSSLVKTVGDSVVSIVFKIVLGCIVSLFVLGVIFSLKYEKREETERTLTSAPTYGITAFIGVISSVYVVYLFSQLAYLFSAFKSILPSGYEFTYAEYARRGFFELCIIAAINLALILAAIIISKKNSGKLPAAIKILCSFIAVFTLIIIATSISKMVMYIDVYGMTVLRISTSAFMIWMALVFIAALVRLYVRRLDVLSVGLAAGLAVLSVLGIFNVRGYVAKYNYEAHVAYEKAVDVRYMETLGDEGVEYLYHLTKDENKKTASEAEDALIRVIPDYYKIMSEYVNKIKTLDDLREVGRQNEGFFSFSFPSERACNAIEQFFADK
ncbi:MAG: DUF4173 domain-containing protein [Clostridia bacterium]|nr:DUF4173 domain-containing protein [Clostridia bacterium]